VINGKKVVAVVPARGGSKRLPRKNVLPLMGKPLITWSLEAASKSKYIDQVIVSTDDSEIADICQELGYSVPELRPDFLATDTAKTGDVLLYSLEKHGEDAEIAVLLQPTSPLRTSEHIDEALELFILKNAISIVSVTPCEHPPLWANTLPESLSMGNFIHPEAMKRSQDCGDYFRFNGAVYVFDVEYLQQFGEIRYTKDSFAYIMDNHVSFDIDTQLDFELAEFFMNRKQGQS